MPPPTERPPIVSSASVPEKVHRYPNSEEALAPSRPIGRAAGLLRIGLHVERVTPGTRISWPHAEEKEEEFVHVVDGEVEAWIDGELYPMKKDEQKSDLLSPPSAAPERSSGERVVGRRPAAPQGPHDGKPDAR